ncbi:unnamed protein product [Ceratitis capitata]|uniref:(Mediterranean fruit fly) hypothetical protein n=1 Tax=Ceratitis capitata TaxID=7213 RepID=A0A811ULR9_CERCA|nr:unnamed protein product [Ceratitis capitata]
MKKVQRTSFVSPSGLRKPKQMMNFSMITASLLFKFFTNPVELQKHFERQMQQILEAVSEFEEGDVKLTKI